MFVLILIWIVFFYPWIFKHLHPIPSDIISGMYYPFIEQKLGPIAGIPVKNPLLTDTVSQFWIWRNWAIAALKSGEISIWNPYSLAGQPMSPWFHTILFSPLNTFYFVLDQMNAMSAIVATQLFFSLFFSYLLLKKITSNNLSSIFGSLSFSFSSFFIGWLTWGTISSTLAFLPLAIWSLLNIKTSSHISYKIYFFISLLFALLSGHPQTFLYFSLTVGSFILINKIIKKTYLIILFAILTSSTVLLPSFEIIIHSIRATDQFVKNNNFGFIHPFEIITGFITPGFFGTPATNNYWGIFSNFQEKLVWFGTIPFIFCLSWLLDKIKTKKYDSIDKWLVIVFIIGILLSTRYPLGFLIYDLKVPFLSTSPAGRAFILTIFTGSIMAAKHFGSGKKISIKATLALLTSLYLSIAIFSFLDMTSESNLRISLRNLTLSSALIVTTIFMTYFPKRLFQFSIIILTIFDLLYFATKYTPFTPEKYYFPKNDLLNSIKPVNDFYRVEREQSELLPPNMWQAYGLSSTQGYDPTLSGSYLSYLQQESLVIDATRFVEWKTKEIPLLPDLGIKYALTLKKDSQDKISPSGFPPEVLTRKGWTLYEESGSVAILKNPKYKPPYYLSKNGELKLTNKTDSAWNFNISSATDNDLVIIENHDPGNWFASIDGKQTEIDIYNKTFKSISVPKGIHQVNIYYKNRLIILGGYISLISLLSFIIYILIIKKYDPKT